MKALHADSFLVNFAFGGNPPRTTTLCAFFWRVVGKGLGLVGVLALVFFALSSMGVAVYRFWREMLQVLAYVVPVAAVVSLMALFLSKRRRAVAATISAVATGIAESLPVQMVIATKKKFCPIIEIQGVRKYW